MAEIKEHIVLVLQGGGALGAYQAGAYQALADSGLRPDWVAGISIGAINAALICGNEPEKRLAALQGVWDRVTSRLAIAPWFVGPFGRMIYGEAAAATVMATGVPGFFKPRPPAAFLPLSHHSAISVYDTTPLRDTLLEFVDFDHLNTTGPRLSVGAVDVETANFVYFDSAKTRITPNTSWPAAPCRRGSPRSRSTGGSTGMAGWSRTRRCSSSWTTSGWTRR